MNTSIIHYLKNLRTSTKGYLVISVSIFLFLIFFVLSYQEGEQFYYKSKGIIPWILDSDTRSFGYIQLKYHLAICLIATAFGTFLIIVDKAENNSKNIN